jgi:succinate dehydrogenase / fumarate reductase membrane anchor subunit
MPVNVTPPPTNQPPPPSSGTGEPGWWFMRLSGLLLLFMALFHLTYMHLLVPGGVSHTSYATIAAGWTDPVWGFSRRFFDLLLLVLSLSHGALGLRNASNRYLPARKANRTAQLVLVITYLVLSGGSIWMIFTFQL